MGSGHKEERRKKKRRGKNKRCRERTVWRGCLFACCPFPPCFPLLSYLPSFLRSQCPETDVMDHVTEVRLVGGVSLGCLTSFYLDYFIIIPGIFIRLSSLPSPSSPSCVGSCLLSIPLSFCPTPPPPPAGPANAYLKPVALQVCNKCDRGKPLCSCSSPSTVQNALCSKGLYNHLLRF